MVHIGNRWDEILADEFKKDYYLKIRAFLKEEYAHYQVYPDMHDIFNSLRYAAYDDIKVVIIGQDPYHEQGQAHGLSFSVPVGIPTPPSLQNIFKELHEDLGLYIPNNGCLKKWAEQGVLLLNNVLTVRRGQANSHKTCGWETFTDEVIKKLNEREKPVVFLLWGASARHKQAFITGKQHTVLTAAHPSPLSAYNGFFGCRHFSKANEIIKANNMAPIDWQIVNVNP